MGGKEKKRKNNIQCHGKFLVHIYDQIHVLSGISVQDY
jgi:hypothetical protein